MPNPKDRHRFCGVCLFLSCFFPFSMLYYSHKRINADHTVIIVYRTRGMTSLLDDKGIAVKVRGNSHYRNSRTWCGGSSRNAYRSVPGKSLSGRWGRCGTADTADIRHSQHPGEGAFVLSFCMGCKHSPNSTLKG